MIWADVATGVLALAMLIALVRLVLGPTLPDRAVAFEVMMVAAMAAVAIDALRTGRTALIDAALLMALVGLLGTLAIARHVEQRATR